jgi:hypothetical protein
MASSAIEGRLYMTAIYYVLRARTSGQYLCAQPDPAQSRRYLLVFTESFDALSYLNTHAYAERDQLTSEALPVGQLKGVLGRWQLQGLGLVTDPLLPKIEFQSLQSEF